MTPERWTKVKQVLEGALAQPVDARRALLDSACAGDTDLRKEVDSLLEAHDQARGFLENPPFPSAATDRAPSEPPRSLRPHDRLGPYEIVSAIGAGGMGEVYRARDGRLGREVAIKVLALGSTSHGLRLKRFELEARAASALNHPNIVAVHDVGSHDGLPYLVTELLEGRTLADCPVPMVVRKAIELSIQVAAGLADAHEHGIVHRDVKPANLFLTATGQLKILDFGVAKLARESALGRDDTVTEPGLVIGTAGYMSPEQARGEPVDFRADQFSLGCVLYELLAGRAPFRRPTAAQTIAALLDEEPPPLSEAGPQVPRHVAWVVERCLAKDPGQRYAATRDLERDLELTLQRLSETNGAPPARSRRASRWAVLAAACAAALATLGVQAGPWLRREPTSAVTVPRVHLLTHSGTDTSPAAAPDGNLIAFSSRRDGRRRIWLRQIATGSEAPLTSGDDDDPRFSPDGATVLFTRTDEGRSSLYRTAVVGGETRKVVDNALFGDFSPDGTRLAFVRRLVGREGVTAIVGTSFADGSSPRELARFDEDTFSGGAFVGPRWSPDGRTLAATQGTLQLSEPFVITLIDTASGAVRRLAAPGDASVWRGALVWAGRDAIVYSQPDTFLGTQTGDQSSRIVLWNLATGATRPLLSSPSGILTIDILRPGRLVLQTRSLRQNLREIPLSPAGASERWLTSGAAADRQPTYTRDGSSIAFSSNRSGHIDIWAMSPRDGTLRRVVDNPADDIDPGFMPDGRLIFSSNRSGAFEIWIAEADGSEARQVTADGVDAENPVATPDGGWIVYSSGNPRSRGIMKIRPDGSEASLIAGGNLIMPEVSPDGRHVAFVADLGSEGAALRVVRFADGATVFEIPLPPSRSRYTIDQGRCRWMPDGSGLAFIMRTGDGHGVFAQPFVPGRDTSEGRRLLAKLGSDLDAESLGISPDGAFLTVSFREELHAIVLAEDVHGLGGAAP